VKVVLFCGGLGLRIREAREQMPKPMVTIGYRPILWHVMKYYAHFGHKDFILCLGFRGDMIKNFFRHYDECVSNNFVLSNGGQTLELLNRDIDDWRISFVDTGLSSNVGQRLQAVEEHLVGEEVFLANYVDGLTDLDLTAYVRYFREHNKTASFICVTPTQSFHVVATSGNLVTGIRHIGRSGIEMNGGYFIFHRDIFRYLRDGEELVEEPFQRLIEAQPDRRRLWIGVHDARDRAEVRAHRVAEPDAHRDLALVMPEMRAELVPDRVADRVDVIGEPHVVVDL